MKTFVVTGGAGFFGGILKRQILERGDRCVSIDVCPDEDEHPNLLKLQLDLRDSAALNRAFAAEPVHGVIHCAAVLAHGSVDRQALRGSNVEGTRNVAEAMRRNQIRHLVFTSTNCLWGEGLNRPVREDDPPKPVELYGQSKLEAEEVIREYSDLIFVIIRCPTIIDFGRLGLLAILFEFIHEGRRVWTVGGGRNRYQFIYAGDLAKACLMAVEHGESDTFNIGSDGVKPLADIYRYVITTAGSKSKVASLPLKPTLAAMKVAYHLHVSPLGPYHYKMIAEDFLFDTSRIKNKLGWQPTLTNEEMLWRAYQYYAENRRDIEARQNVSAHRRNAKMGVIRLLKWVS
ncbi:MAG TPA: NAD(P)-dependent oxidoreductase [Candidatus Acidoferrales bacterium]|nr:NAD(P)-dependent oxidoreductase [Candidatus Acidoferrales bacterium]